MEGGIGIFLLLVLLVVAVGGGIALYLTGGALLGGGGADDDADEPRPVHKAPRDPTQDHVHLVGTPEGDAAARRER
jgi:hypothetical protein